MTNFILCYLPEDVHDQTLPTNLRRLPDSTTDHRKAHGFSSRTIVGIGHSVGACSLCVSVSQIHALISHIRCGSIYPAVEFPALFSSLVLVESMTIPEYIKQMDAHRKYESICLRRRWVWDSRYTFFFFFIQCIHHGSAESQLYPLFPIQRCCCPGYPEERVLSDLASKHPRRVHSICNYGN